jgi:ADP-heptose:LPS heptosyltransferase
VFTGSSRANKLWPTEYFVSVTEYIVNTYNLTPVVCGSKDDLEYVEKFIAAYGKKVINKCGQTSLTEFANILKQAKLLLSVDTGSVHIAAAMDCPVYGIFNGIHLGRFAPYPKNVSANVHAIFPDEVDKDLAKGNYGRYQFSSPFPYSAVSAEKVIATIAATFTM